MDQKSITFTQAIEGYFVAAQARRLSPHTLSDYDNTYRRFETFLGHDPRSMHWVHLNHGGPNARLFGAAPRPG